MKRTHLCAACAIVAGVLILGCDGMFSGTREGMGCRDEQTTDEEIVRQLEALEGKWNGPVQQPGGGAVVGNLELDFDDRGNVIGGTFVPSVGDDIAVQGGTIHPVRGLTVDFAGTPAGSLIATSITIDSVGISGTGQLQLPGAARTAVDFLLTQVAIAAAP